MDLLGHGILPEQHAEQNIMTHQSPSLLPSAAMSPAEPRAPLRLIVENLSKFYGRTVGCNDINLELARGEILGIVGGSGAGKSTLIKCITGHVRPTNGTIRLHASGSTTDLGGPHTPRTRRIIHSRIGYVAQTPQEGLRMDISAGGNITRRLLAGGMRHYGKMRRTAQQWLDRVDIDPERVDDFPGTFSRCMRRRLHIAAQLAGAPRVLLLDDPADLDHHARVRLTRLLKQQVAQHDLSVLLVTRDPDLARPMTDRIHVMEQGGLIETGPDHEIFNTPPLPASDPSISA